jgi:hypothetical protein
LLTLTAIRPAAPAALKLTNAAAVAPATAATAIVDISRFIGTSTELTLTATVSKLASEYVWDLPTGTNITEGAVTTVSNSIKVNFLNVPAGAATYYLGVFAKNGINLSTRDNSLLVPAVPLSSATARVLRVAALVATVPASLRSLNGPLTVTNISTFIGTSTPLTLTTAVVPNALSYTYTVPAGVDIAEDAAGDTSTSTTATSFTTTLTTVTVDYEGVAPAIASIPVAVRANNFVGSSIDRTLNLTASAPATPTVTGTLAICPSAATNVVYTISTLAVGATSYLITAPAGATVNGGGITATIAAVTGATFTVNYPSGFLSPVTAPLFLNIASVNGFGSNLLNRVLKLTNSTIGCPAPRLADSVVANEFKVIAYPNPSSSEFTIATSAKGAINVKVYDMQGRLVESTTSTQVGSRLAKGVYNVIVNQGANTKSVRVIKN